MAQQTRNSLTSSPVLKGTFNVGDTVIGNILILQPAPVVTFGTPCPEPLPNPRYAVTGIIQSIEDDQLIKIIRLSRMTVEGSNQEILQNDQGRIGKESLIDLSSMLESYDLTSGE